MDEARHGAHAVEEAEGLTSMSAESEDVEREGVSGASSSRVVLVGLMGAGKSAVGRRLAARLGTDFVDADVEIEAAAGCSVEEIFNRDGEAVFRAAERRIISQLLTERAPHVLATGGGAFMDPETRAVIKRHGLSVWLRAELDVLVARTSRRSNRPLLKGGDPRAILERLIAQRYPVYAEADITVDSDDRPLDETVERVLEMVAERQS